MRSAMRIAHNVRLAAILAVGAFALHQLRYLLTIGSSAEVAEASHRYMADLLPPIAVLVLAAVVATLIRGTEGASPERTPLARRIAVFAGALLAIFLGQESLEAILAPATRRSRRARGERRLARAAARSRNRRTLGAARKALERVERAIAVVHASGCAPRPPAVRGRALPARGRRLPSHRSPSASPEGRLRRHLPSQVPASTRCGRL